MILQEKHLKVLKCYCLLWVQRRQNCSPAASFANCVMTLYLLKVQLQTFLSIPVTQKYQILSCDTLVANEQYVPHLSPFHPFHFLSLSMFVPVTCTERRPFFSTPLQGTQFTPLSLRQYVQSTASPACCWHVAISWYCHKGRFTHSMPCSYRAHAVPMPLPCHAVPLIHTCHAAPLPCSDNAVSFVKVRVVAGNIRTASPTV